MPPYRRPRTAAEETSARLGVERSAPFSPTHTYEPIGWDQYDPRGTRSPIEPGEPVELLREHTRQLHQGMPPSAKRMFNVVRDGHGNVQHVSRDSLGRLGKP